MFSLRWKLAGAFLLVVLVSVGLTAFLANLSTGREFSQYVSRGNAAYARDVAESLEQFYARRQSWDGVQAILTGLTRSGNDRLVVADSSGLIVGDTDRAWLGDTASAVGLAEGMPLAVSGQEAGTLFPIVYGAGHNQGMMGMMGRGMMAGMNAPGTVILDSAQQDFLDSINRSLLTVGLIAAGVALLLGLFLTRQVTNPMRTLSEGAHRIAAGDLSYRAPAKAKDELGDLSRSFNVMAASLDRAEQTRRRLTADISHELRTPLTIIEGTVDAILDGVFTADSERLTSIKEQTALLTRLINDLRDISLAESGQLKLELSPVDLPELLRRITSQAEIKAAEKGIRQSLTVAGAVPVVLADPARIEQVIGNLLANAVRHTPPGGDIKVAVSQVSSDPAHGISCPSALIAVADNGEGIPAEALPNVFERFYRVGASRARSEGGSGLGLAIVKQMVLAHGGAVWAQSEPGKGSTFFVSLPVAPVENAAGANVIS
ncbi:MAG: HAMP domain-containing histidine kinase [Chloroflexi bacterium]|nr:HAMP domain-containing histidine kinase [Chloroflexota bacterium]